LTPLEWEIQHKLRIEQYAKQIDAIFNKAVVEATSIGQLFNAADLLSKPFEFSDYPQTKDRIDKLMNKMNSEINATVVNGVSAEWEDSNYKNDQIAQKILGYKPDEIPSGNFQKYFNNNDQAREAFLKRADYGMNLSDRVWNYTNSFKKEIELGLDVGIRLGISASEMAGDLKQYLKYPDKLFRRVRDEHGDLQLSKAAAAFHPGQGVYRSSYKNALRLTRTETNMAYRAADHERMQQWDFIVGFEVHVSNSHVIEDICDDLEGAYPKDFVFSGWHAQCMCWTTTILKTPEEIDADMQKIMDGEPVDANSVNEVKDIPDNFKQWAADNEQRIATAKNMPYFIKDNFNGNDVNKWFIQPNEIPKINPLFKNFTSELNKDVLFRGDIRDKGNIFTSASNMMDYKLDGDIKNKAGFHWFTSEKSYAEKYATEQMSTKRGLIEKQILTEIQTGKIEILDFTKMNLTDEVNFMKNLYDSGLNELMHKQGLLPLLKEGEIISKKELEKLLGRPIIGSILPQGAQFSDRDMGVKFFKWLKDNGFGGYKFKEYQWGDEIGLLSEKYFKITSRKYY
jgi:hypothetical protein